MTDLKNPARDVKFSHLDTLYPDMEEALDEIRALVKTGDFTLGKPMRELERRFAAYIGVKHAISVASGTDALMLSLRALGMGPGDEVITSPTTFIATVGAIAMMGASPVFVDSEDGFVIDTTKMEAAITPRTKALLPVHYTGNAADLPTILEIAKRHGLPVIEDACQAIGADIHGKRVGSWGITGCFSFHPVKHLNVWGDGGVITTDNTSLAERIELLRNHGLINRDEAVMFGLNSRLHSLQAIVANRQLAKMDFITGRRIEIARRYDMALAHLSEYIGVPKRRPGVRHSYCLYIVRAKERDGLLEHLQKNGVEAKIHYPIPVHLQKGAAHLGYKPGDFPMAEADATCMITLPANEAITNDDVDYVVEQVSVFYRER